MVNFLCINYLVISLAIALFVLTGSVSAEEENDLNSSSGKFDGNVAITSNYLSRGISQSNRYPALQGMIEYDLGTDCGTAYASIWGSNVDFDDQGQAIVELDNSLGLKGILENPGMNWNIGIIYYAYPGSDTKFRDDYVEAFLQLSHALIDITQLGIQYYYSPNYSGNAGYGHFVNGTIEITPSCPIEWATLVLNGAVGYQWVENNVRAGFDNYATWNMGPTVKIGKISLNALYSGTTLNKENCYEGKAWCDDTVVFTVNMDF